MDNVLILIGMAAGLAGAIYQGGKLEATLESGLRAEADARQRDVAGLAAQLASQGQDIRDIRAWVISGRLPHHD